MAASAWLSLLAVCLGPRSGVAVQTACGGANAAVAVPEGRDANAKKLGTFYLGSDLAWDSCSAAGICTVDGHMVIDGHQYSKGIYAHAYERFIGCIGILEGATGCGTSSRNVNFEVKVNGARLYNQDGADFNDQAICVDPDVNFKMKMELLAGNNGDGTCDWSAWVDARVTNDDSISWDSLGTDVAIGSRAGYACVADKAHAADDIVIGDVLYPKGALPTRRRRRRRRSRGPTAATRSSPSATGSRWRTMTETAAPRRA